MIIKALRLGLGQLIVLGDLVTRPAKLKRTPVAQAAVEQAASDLTLYQFNACPFCVKIRRKLHRLNVPVALRDAKNDPQHRQALAEQGGKIQVPCLRIEENGQSTWLYESKAIAAYLEQRFAISPA
ncbi:glutaredoxin family protein [Phytopseudomonas daroniae]|uniref:glutaredoxin family protein n=1 Tax=Phytopseudomonas daroniae TaxID=2487519 RepID=UPI0010382E74|nr:glutaredoxin [Pseudomonas daroniae]TBU73567.1 glutaredoxin [Pseudomonas daroniae]